MCIRDSLAAVPNFAHGGVDPFHRVKQAGVAAIGATQQIALAHDLYIQLLHAAPRCVGLVLSLIHI